MNEYIAKFLSYAGAPALLISVVVQAVPVIAAIVAIVWYLVQIYESKTVQRWLSNRQQRRLARMKAAVLMLEAKQLPLPPDMVGPKDPPT